MRLNIESFFLPHALLSNYVSFFCCGNLFDIDRILVLQYPSLTRRLKWLASFLQHVTCEHVNVKEDDFIQYTSVLSFLLLYAEAH